MSTATDNTQSSASYSAKDIESQPNTIFSKEEIRQKTQELMEAQYDMAAQQTHDAYSGYDPFDADTNGLSSRDQVILRDVYSHFKGLKYIILCSFIVYICSFFEIAIIIFPVLGIFFCERVNINGAIYYLVYSILSIFLYIYFLIFTYQQWEGYYAFFGSLFILPYYYLILALILIGIHLAYIAYFIKFSLIYKKLDEKVKPVLYNLRDLYK